MRDHFYPLDVLRFFAAFCVLSFHLGFFGWASEWGTTAAMLNHTARYEPLAPFTWFGWVGVQIFFVISGFVIANSAYGRSSVDFLKGRILRLYPAAWICATITLIAWVILGGMPIGGLVGEYLRSMTLWLAGPWIDGPYWSLAVEIVFYALVFLVISAGRFIQLTAIPWALTALSLTYLVLVHVTNAPSADSPTLVGKIVWFAEALLARHGCYFAAGIWLWLMSRGQMTPLRYTGLAIAIGCGVAEIIYTVSQMNRGEFTTGTTLTIWEPLTVWLVAFAFIVTVVRAPHLFDVRSPRLQAALKRIGLMTYPMFLVHNVVGAGVIRTSVELGVNQWVALLLAVAVALALGYIISATAEVEVRKHLRNILDRFESAIRAAIARPKAALRP